MEQGNVINLPGSSRSLASAEPQMRLPASQREADPFDVVAVDRPEFVTSVMPCLQLVAPVGMTGEEQDTWFEAAFVALQGIPIGLLKRGALAAMRTADHHSKIVPAIIAEVRGAWDTRKRLHSSGRPQPALPAPMETAEEKAERLEVAALMDGLVRKLSANA